MIGRYNQLGVYRELVRSRDFYIIIFAGLLALASWIVDYNDDAISKTGAALAIFSVAINGLPIIWGAIKGLYNRQVNVDELVSIAIAASLFRGEFLTAAVVGFVMTLGGLIEEITSESARKAIKSLIEITPQTATVVDDQGPRTVPVEKVKVDDTILIKPGERIPVDAVITKGVSAIDESAMTGEPLPGEKGPGDSIMAGTLNYNGVIEARVVRVGEDAALGKVIKLISEAEHHKPEVIRLVDRFAIYFTPAILACAAIAWVLTGDVDRAVAVLIVGCPCALILAAPTATVAALGRAAKAGILVKGGHILERAGLASAFLFDKTGTLTMGEPRVDKIVCIDGVDQKDLLSYAAGAEENCTHPLARAVLKAAFYAKVVVKKAEEVINEVGLGVKAVIGGSLVEVGNVDSGAAILPTPLSQCVEDLKERGSTPLLVFRDSRPIGVMGVSDKLRPDAKEAISRLKKMGVRNMALLSGDHEKSACNVAEEVGLPDVFSEMKPGDKLEIIKKYQEQGHKVLFVGDGINDAPALAAADVGAAMGAAGTDVALETADVALMHDDISRLPFLVSLSRRMLLIIKFNLVFGLIFNAFAVLASGWGLLSPIAAALVHNIGSVLVVLASASLAIYNEKTAEQ